MINQSELTDASKRIPDINGMRGERRFARLVYNNCWNLGDEIQSLSAQAFLPHVDVDVDREALDSFLGTPFYHIILNGWFLHKPWRWPPSPTLVPLITSFHITDSIFAQNSLGVRPSDFLLNESSLGFFEAHGPIGARDLHTRDLLRAHGIDSYFSGCLTLTLACSNSIEERTGVIAVDVPEEVTSVIESHQKVRIERLTHVDCDTHIPTRFLKAQKLLQRYARAKCVITSRLHCALPCLALGTPVMFLDIQPDKCRFSGFLEFLNAFETDHIVSRRYEFDVRSPAKNSESWYPLRDNLIERCELFTGSKKRPVL